MKTLIETTVITALLLSGVAVMAQGQNEEYLGLPGDNLNLYAVLSLFQESKTLEEFEKNLNDENSRINNLDLNGDNLIDYINVYDNVKGNVHNIVLQVAVSEKERQDIAVFTVERDKKGNVMLQLTGDEELYGANYIIEPAFDGAVTGGTPNPGYTGNASAVNGRKVVVVNNTVVGVERWPVITYIYNPGYVVWRSSWHWGYYPTYWNPWKPYYWHYYYGYHYNYYDSYYGYYRRTDFHRHNYYHDYYYRPYRSHSTYVTVNVKNGNYKSTYSKPEERSRGEALYSSTHRDNSSGRSESVRVADGNRRTSVGETTRKNTSGSAATSTRRSESSVSGRASGNNRSSGQARSSESRTTEGAKSTERRSSQTRPTEARTQSQTRPTEARTPSQARSSGSKSSSQARPAQPASRQTSKASAPARREAKQTTPVKSDSGSKSRTGDSKNETRRR